MRISPIFTSFLAATAIGLGPAAQADPVQDRGVAFLAAQQAADGSLSSPGSAANPLFSTSEAVRALRALNVRPDVVGNAQLYLSLAHPGSLDEQARRIGALSRSPYADASGELLLRQMVSSGTLSFAPGFEATPDRPSLLEAASVLAALAPIDGDPSLAQSAKVVGDGLLAEQSNSGWQLTDESTDLAISASVAEVLAPLRFYPEFPAPLKATLQNVVLAAQSPSGAFGDGQFPVVDTAHALLALQSLGSTAASLNAQAAQSAVAYLQSAQLSDGSWNESVYDTALVLRALATWRPNWATRNEFGFSLVSFSNGSPLAGDRVIATVVITNASAVPAPASTGRFYAKSEPSGTAIALGDAPLPALAPGQQQTVTFNIDSTGMSGSYTITAIADPDNLTGETREDDNSASSILSVVQGIDLAIANSDVTFDVTGTQLTVSARIHNVGSALSTPFHVAFYRGNPGSNGVALGTATVSTISSGISTTVTATTTTTGLNGPTPFYVVVDSDNSIKEAREDNNTGYRFYMPGSGHAVDLAITNSDFVLTPAHPRANQPVDIIATIHNLSAYDAQRATLAQLDDTNGLVQQVEVPLVPANGTAQVHLRTVVGGNWFMYFAVQPESGTTDTNPINNSTAISVTVGSSGTDFAVQSLTVSNGALQADIRNPGGTSESAVVTLYRGDPRFGPAQALGQRPLMNLGTYNSVTFAGVTIADGQLFVACVAPTNGVDTNPVNDCASTTQWRDYNHQADFKLSTNDIQISPLGPDIGEAVHLVATVHNAGLVDGSAVATLWQGPPRTAGSKLIGFKPVAVPASGTATAAFDFLREAGETNFYVSVDDPQPADSNINNNVGVRNLFLKTLINTGRTVNSQVWMTAPVVGDLLHDGHPSIVFGQLEGPAEKAATARVTMEQLSPDGGYQEVLSAALATTSATRFLSISPPVIADLDNDGVPEIVVHVHDNDTQTPTSESFVAALRPDGTLKWKTNYHIGYAVTCTTESEQRDPGIADVDGDGIADVIVQDTDLRAFSGKDGSVIWDKPDQWKPGIICAYGQVSVADVDDDGLPEITTADGTGDFKQFDHNGVLRWSTTEAGSVDFAFLDVNLDGHPELVFPYYGGASHTATLGVLDARTGKHLAQDDVFSAWPWTVASAPVRQDGLPAVVLGNNSYTSSIAAMGPDLAPIWFSTTTYINEVGFPWVSSLADVMGLGRPQVISQAMAAQELSILDSRNGTILLNSRVANGTSSSWVASPTIADADGDGIADIITMHGYPSGYMNQPYPNGEFMVFSSAHWKRMPTTWPASDFVKGQIDDQFRVNTLNQSWKTHNTWKEQFVDEPAHLMPDLSVAAGDLSVLPAQPAAGSAATVSVNVHNLGGVAASNVTVDLYDGSPDAGAPKVGTAVLAGPIAAVHLNADGGRVSGTATAQIAWTPYPEGDHILTAVVNAGHQPAESGYENNQASTRVFVTPGSTLADLVIDASSLQSAPAAPVAGTPSTLSATVRNVGPLDSGAFAVSFYDGVPAASGSNRIAQAQVSSLAQGASAPVSAAWSPLPGGHVIYVVADAEQATLDSDRSNNAASFSVTSPAESSPDLTILAQDLIVTPAAVVPGQQVTLTATVRNLGTAIDDTAVAFYAADPTQGAQPIATLPIYSHLEPGGTATVSATLPTAAWTGTVALYAVVDPANAIAESNEANNTAQTRLALMDPKLTVVASTDRSSYPANATVTASAHLVNAAPQGRALSVDLFVANATGAVVATIASGVSAPINAGGTRDVSSAWVANANAGAYTLHARVHEAGALIAESAVPFSISSDAVVASTITTDKVSYLPGESALLHQVLRNTGTNGAAGPLTSTLTISSAGLPVFQKVRTISSLGAQSVFQASDLFSVGATLPPGSYPATLEVRDSNNVIVSSAQTTLVIQAAPPSVALTGTLAASPNPFVPGQTVQLTSTLTNRGNVAIDTTAEVDILNAASLASVATLSGLAHVDVASSQQLALSWTSPSSLPVGDFLAVLSVDGKVLARTGLSSTSAPPDTSPPQVDVSGVSDLEITSSNVTPVITITDQSAFTSTILLDGAPFTSGTLVNVEGSHLLSVDAVDVYNNATHVVVRFSIDRTPPAISVIGVSQGEITSADVTPLFSADDPHLALVSATLNGASFVSGTPITTEGDYTLVVTAVDAAGNTASVTVGFTIDRTPPVISVSGVSDGQLINGSLTPTFSATDAHLASVAATLDGTTFTSGTSVSAEGDHALKIVATDAAGNRAETDVHFAIDLTPPVIHVAGVADGLVTKLPVTPTFSADDAHPGSITATLNSIAFTSGAAVATEGAYTLVVTAQDAAGNTSQQTIHFAIDQTPPTISISGVSQGQIAAGTLTPIFAANDLHGATVSATLNGSPWVSGMSVYAEGDYTLVVTATDQAGNSATQSITFSIDLTGPTITISGISDGQISATPVTITFGQQDAHPGTTTATLNGAPFNSGSSVSAAGDYTLVVTAQDLAGHTASQSLHFSIDLTAPTITITGVTDGQVTSSNVTPSYSATDPHLKTVSATLNGTSFASGTLVTAEGDYDLVVTATNAANLTATKSVHFAIDRTSPVITVSGVTDGSLVNASAVPTFAATDAHLTSVSATLDGVPFVSGTGVMSDGDHVLSVSASDQAGNTASRTVHFTIDRTAPTIAITGVTSGATYTSSAPVAQVTVTDAHLDASKTVVQLNGKPYVPGTPISVNGLDTLTVSAQDLAGNTASASVSFTVQLPLFDVAVGEPAHGRVLVGLSCGCGDDDGDDDDDDHGCPSTPVLTAALGQAGLAFDIAPNLTAFRNMMREDRYKAFVLDTSEHVDWALAQELAEHVFEGEGFLYLKHDPDEDPRLRALVGAQTQGRLNGVSSVTITAVLSPTGPLTVAGDLVKLQPYMAQTVATASRNGKSYVVGTSNAYGSGKAIYLAWDPEASYSVQMVSVIASALTVATSGPLPERVALSVAKVQSHLTNRSASTQQVRERVTLPSGAKTLFATPTLTATSPPTWVADAGAGQSLDLDLGFRLPDSAGSNATSVELATWGAGTFNNFDTENVSYVVGRSGAQLLSDAKAALAQLDVHGTDAMHRNAALSDLTSVGTVPTTLEAAECHIGSVLDALGELQAIQSVDVTAVRLSLDALLRYQENQYSNLRGWP